MGPDFIYCFCHQIHYGIWLINLHFPSLDKNLRVVKSGECRANIPPPRRRKKRPDPSMPPSSQPAPGLFKYTAFRATDRGGESVGALGTRSTCCTEVAAGTIEGGPRLPCCGPGSKQSVICAAAPCYTVSWRRFSHPREHRQVRRTLTRDAPPASPPNAGARVRGCRRFPAAPENPTAVPGA